jgi:Zn-dependent peptidase ImmA (M78 family)/transcriptional regulator with XRE-family HTH domain
LNKSKKIKSPKKGRNVIESISSSRRNLPKPIPERIREAREARGLQLDTFAEMLDVTKQAVARFESGLASPSGETMGKIIASTEQPPSFFVTLRDRSASGISPFWRGLKRMEQHHRKRIARRLEWARDIVSYVERFIHLPDVSLPTIDFDPTSNAVEQIEHAADVLRSHWGLGRGPVRDLSAIMELHGFVLIQEKVFCPDMDAVSCWQAGRPYILFSAEVTSGPRDYWNLAHELGHILLHPSIEVAMDNLSLIEQQANRFAGAFLLPQDTFSREVLGTSLNHFLFLKEKWGVAIAAMAYRCKDLGIINTNQHSYVMRQLNLKKIRKHEPLDDKFKMRPPSILSECIKILLDKGVQTKGQVEEALALNPKDIESLSGLPKDYLGSTVVQFRPRLYEPEAK